MVKRESLSPTAVMKLLQAKRPRNNRGVADKPDRTYKGVVYASKAEAVYAFGLDRRVESGDLVSWERQVRYRIIVNGTYVCSHFIDFKENKRDGSFLLVEVKGYFTEMYRLKAKLLRAAYPGISQYYQVIHV